jgi:GNAT superfamily N-acetyltransferase
MNVRRVSAALADPHEFLDGANRAFGQWGDEATFRWAFRGDAELLFLDGVAAFGIVWRTLTSGERAAIITGAWTLPEARRLGAFSRLVGVAREVAQEREAIVLGFVRAENPSARGLASAGGSLVPTFYCRAEARVCRQARSPALSVLDPDRSVFNSSFVYSADEWRAQFLERPHAELECVGVRGEWMAIVERTREFDRVHAISDVGALSSLVLRAHAAGRRLFWFSTTRPAIECEWTDGFLAVVGTSAFSDWELQNGDRM